MSNAPQPVSLRCKKLVTDMFPPRIIRISGFITTPHLPRRFTNSQRTIGAPKKDVTVLSASSVG